MQSYTPSDSELVDFIRVMKSSNGDLLPGQKKILQAIKLDRKNWTVGEKRLKKIIQNLDTSNLIIPSSEKSNVQPQQGYSLSRRFYLESEVYESAFSDEEALEARSKERPRVPPSKQAVQPIKEDLLPPMPPFPQEWSEVVTTENGETHIQLNLLPLDSKKKGSSKRSTKNSSGTSSPDILREFHIQTDPHFGATASFTFCADSSSLPDIRDSQQMTKFLRDMMLKAVSDIGLPVIHRKEDGSVEVFPVPGQKDGQE
eukprot:TRINITY_DN6554_c0_g1_i1.p2 TRINITY_DN6554_c0_g1~~TRINITY_DN6554_c0_g1_i1.p2  ORF type:complete len:257 (-),score=48.87 TRINITY_DN6554_c0_g1_i1:1322-2092(-)